MTLTSHMISNLKKKNMGEQSIPPKENDFSKNGKEQQNGDATNGDEENGNEEDITPEEFANLDNQLNALNTALDEIEQKNDDIHSQLLQLLDANREVRQQLKLDQEANTPMDTDSNPPKQ